jgi:hypothetical protein
MPAADLVIANRRSKTKTKFPWMYVAASFVGFLLLGTVYFNQNSEIIYQKMMLLFKTMLRLNRL